MAKSTADLASTPVGEPNAIARLGTLGLAMGDDLRLAWAFAAEALAARRPVDGRPVPQAVTRTMALVGAMEASEHVARIVDEAKLDRRVFLRDAGLEKWTPSTDVEALDDVVLHDNALHALDVYAREFGSLRPELDALGLSWALLALGTGRLFPKRIRDAHADPDALRELLRDAIDEGLATSQVDTKSLQEPLDDAAASPDPIESLADLIITGSSSQRRLAQVRALTITDQQDRQRLLDVLIERMPTGNANRDAGGRSFTLNTLGRLGASQPRIHDLLVEHLDGRREHVPFVRYFALVGLHQGGAADVANHAERLSKRPDRFLQLGAHAVLAAHGNEKAARHVESALGSDERLDAIRVLRDVPTAVSANRVREILGGSDVTPVLRADIDVILRRQEDPNYLDDRPDLGDYYVEGSLDLSLGYAAALAGQVADSDPPDNIDSLWILAGLLTAGEHVDRLDANRAMWRVLVEDTADGGPTLGALDLYRDHERLDETDASWVESLAQLTTDGQRLLAAADRVRRTVGGDRWVGPRHVFAALLSDRDLAGYRRLVRLGRDTDRARTALVESMPFIAAAAAEDSAAWRRVLIEANRHIVAGRADFVTDAIDGRRGLNDDRLDVEREVTSLCDLIASTKVRPPLAIGLFGDWGTGKTTFMRMMQSRLNDLSTYAGQVREAGGTTTLHADIAQVEFNAWNYVDANLWPSLVTHIFREMSVHFGKRQDQWDELIAEAPQARRVLEQAKDHADRAARRHREATERAKRAKRAADAERKKLEGLGRLRALWRALRDQVRTNWKDVVGLVAIAVVLVALGAMLRAVGSLPSVASWIAAGSTFVFGLSHEVIWPAVNKARSIRAELDKVQKMADEEIDEAVAEQLTRIDAREAPTLAELHEAAQEQQEAREELDAAERRLSAVRHGEHIGAFMHARATDPAYRDHLGIIDVIREDFEGLSRLIERKQKNGGSRDSSDDDGSAPTVALDRIVLYIDDLDRCPSDRVCDVLQAIHLLLALPLFVVVVAVDPRWLMHSLERAYTSFGANDRTGNGSEWRTTPQNYLEKIFHIPFTLRPMDPTTGYRRLITDLLQPSLADREPGTATDEDEHDEGEAAAARTTATPDDGPDAGPGVTAVESDRHDVGGATPVTDADGQVATATASESGGTEEIVSSVGRARATEVPSIESGSPVADSVDEKGSQLRPAAEGATQLEAGMDEEQPFDADPPGLTVTHDEAAFIARLGRLMGTPRSAKRFVNTYRLLKAAARPGRLRRLEERDYEAVLLMLAMQSRYGEEAYVIFDVLMHDDLKPVTTWDAFVESLVPSQPDEGGDHWSNQVVKDLTETEVDLWNELTRELRAVPLRDSNLQPFIDWSRDVARFGFFTGRALRPEMVTPAQAPVS